MVRKSKPSCASAHRFGCTMTEGRSVGGAEATEQEDGAALPGGEAFRHTDEAGVGFETGLRVHRRKDTHRLSPVSCFSRLPSRYGAGRDGWMGALASKIFKISLKSRRIINEFEGGFRK